MDDSTSAVPPNTDDFRRAQDTFIDIDSPAHSYRAIREHCPVQVIGDIAYIALHDDVEAGLRDVARYSSADRVSLGNVRPLIPVNVDPPEHSRYRRILDPLFSPREMSRFAGEFAALANRLIDGFIDRGSCDFATEFAVPLPSYMFLSILGLPLEDLPVLLALNDAVMRPPQGGDVPSEVAAAGRRFYEYFEKHLDARGDHRGDDIISRLLDADYRGETLTHEEVLDILFMLTLAGLDTVTASLECFIAYLAEHPEQRRRLVDDPSLIPSAVEELLRSESPVLLVVRTTTEDVVLRGCEIPKDTPVAFLIGSSNLDEQACSESDVVDFDRDPNRHIAFGRGIHRCLGSHLARLELRVALEELHRRIPDYEIEAAAELAWRGPGIRSLPNLPLRFPVGGSSEQQTTSADSKMSIGDLQ